jgi:membrane protease YdiL (CAAX protease family)
MAFSLFLNKNGKLRNLWWVAVFFLVLAAITFPFILLSQHYKFEITILYQAVIVIAASLICQLLRKEPLSDLFGAFNIKWLKDLFAGLSIGALLMLIPALILFIFGAVSWQINTVDLSKILSVTIVFVAVAVAEEVLFRGFIFQRLISALGNWPAQLIIAGYFLLIHLNNPGMTGNIKLLAGINIFLASVMFGLAFLQTKSLSMPIGMHFMANWVQGVLLGFGVSGNEQLGFLKPIFNSASAWLTGGSFGLEASIPGLITVVITIIFLYRWKPAKS